MIRIFDSLTRRKQDLRPIVPGHVRIYVCGVTVDDYIHIGHARMLTVFDVVCRYLRYRSFRVTFIRNITDIDDKIIRRAARNQESTTSLTARLIEAMVQDCAALGIGPPDAEPCATSYVPQIIDMAQRLIERGYAYVSSNGDVMFDVTQFKGYGALSGRPAERSNSATSGRSDISGAKHDPRDFTIWKQAKIGEPAWDSPWGAGRPGWHIECSAMSVAVLGTTFDIHGGGMDLKFPHHENEIAQARCATGDDFARLWMHNGVVRTNQEKMSKSTGNFLTVRTLLPTLNCPQVLRYFALASHYRSPIDYSRQNLRNADVALQRIYSALRGVATSSYLCTGYTDRFNEAMDDDFNTPAAFAVLHALAREVKQAKFDGRVCKASSLAAELRALLHVLGLLDYGKADGDRNVVTRASRVATAGTSHHPSPATACPHGHFAH